MEEVTTQLKPFKEELKKNTLATEAIGRWKLALWSNGSGGPKGWLELFAERTEEQILDLTSLVKNSRDSILLRDTADKLNAQKALDVSAKDKDRRERVQMWLGVVGGILALLMFVIGAVSLYQSFHVKVSDLRKFGISQSDPSITVVSSAQLPQNAIKRDPW